MLITFVRHTAVEVETGICYGQSDVPLRSSFHDEASVVNQSIPDIDYDAVFTSPLSRCRLLADFCGFPDAIADKRLLELNFGNWELMRFDNIIDPRLNDWYDDWINVTPTNGESFSQMQSRFRSFLDFLEQMSLKKVLVFTHAGILACANIEAGLCDASHAFSKIPPFGTVISLNLR